MRILALTAAERHIASFAEQLSVKTSLDAGWLYRDIIKLKRINRISLEEYEWTGCYKLNEEQKKSVSTLWTRMDFRRTYTDRRYIGLLMNKYIFSKVFSDFYGRKCFQLEDVSPELIKEIRGDVKKVVIKPNCKGQGEGVRVLSVKNDEEINEAMNIIRELGQGVIEEYIIQHEEFNRFNPAAVNIVRFYSLCSPIGTYIFAPVFTTSINLDISNGCQDALTAVADIRNGTVLTDAVDQLNVVDYREHPVTKVPFKGFKIPFWDETIDMMRKAVPLASKISNIGWDVAITPTGPIIIEANTIPGFNTAQYRGFHEVTGGYGYEELFDEGRKGIPFKIDERFEKVVLKIN